MSLAYLRNQDLVASRHAHAYPLALLVQSAGSYCQNLGLVEVLDRAVGQENASGSLGLGLDPLDQDAVEEGSQRLDGFDRDVRLKQPSARHGVRGRCATDHVECDVRDSAIGMSVLLQCDTMR